MKELKPYKHTSIPWERSQGDINGLLVKHRAIGVQWTYMFEENMVSFRFKTRTEINGVEKEIGVEIRTKIHIPIKKDRSGYVVEVDAKHIRQAKNQAYRAVYWWMKAQLEAVEFGIQKIEQVFFSNIVCRLASGETTTLGQALKAGILNQTDFQLESPEVALLPPEKEVAR